MDGSTPIVTIAVGFYIGMSLMGFFSAITRDLITPVVAGVFPGVQASVDKIVIQVGTIKINIGEVISATLNLLTAFFVVTITLPYLKAYAPIGGRR